MTASSRVETDETEMLVRKSISRSSCIDLGPLLVFSYFWITDVWVRHVKILITTDLMFITARMSQAFYFEGPNSARQHRCFDLLFLIGVIYLFF